MPIAYFPVRWISSKTENLENWTVGSTCWKGQNLALLKVQQVSQYYHHSDVHWNAPQSGKHLQLICITNSVGKHQNERGTGQHWIWHADKTQHIKFVFWFLSNLIKPFTINNLKGQHGCIIQPGTSFSDSVQESLLVPEFKGASLSCFIQEHCFQYLSSQCNIWWQIHWNEMSSHHQNSMN